MADEVNTTPEGASQTVGEMLSDVAGQVARDAGPAIQSRQEAAQRDSYDPEGTTGGSRRRCRRCGRFGYQHETVRVQRERGPATAYGYRYLCPD